MSKTRKTPATATVIATALIILWSGGTARPAWAQGPEANPRTWYEAVRTEFKANIERALTHASEHEAPAGALAQLRLSMEGIVANLDREMSGIEALIQAEEAEHNPQEDHFCSASTVVARLAKRVHEDPADAQDALLAGVQCRTAYRGAVSRPACQRRSEDAREWPG